jgi:hypothetical protein
MFETFILHNLLAIAKPRKRDPALVDERLQVKKATCAVVKRLRGRDRTRSTMRDMAFIAQR